MNHSATTTQRWLLATLTSLMTMTQGLSANPAGEQLIQGQAQFHRSSNVLTINQSSQRAIINWQQFSIQQGELTQFIQPGSNSAVLNRVVSGNPSEILGTLKANGQVFLINPNGIVVGNTGEINTQSFVASTLDVSDAEFMAGKDLNFVGDSKATVLNLGHIEAAGGDVYLIAYEVENRGSLIAEQGTVGLAAGSEVLLKMGEEDKLAVRLSTKSGKIDQAGLIEAARVELKAAGNNPYALAINHSGLTRASGATMRNGRVILSAAAGINRVSGEIIAESKTEQSALVSIFSEDTTEFTGTVSAPDQGEVHISGVDKLVFEGQVDTENGDLILDPNNVEITSGAATLAGASTISAGAITGALASNNVVIHTSGTDGEDGDIRVSETVNYSSSNNLSLVAHRHIEVNRSVQNTGNGQINAVAGWDGSTGFSATLNSQQQTGDMNMTAVLADTVSFGNNDGSVFIGDGNQTSGVAFGSRDGETTVAAHDVTIHSGNGGRDYAQIGYRIDSRTANSNSSGDITISANNNLSLVAGNGTDGYAQLGHGGRDFGGPTADGNQSGEFNLRVGNDLNVNAGTGRRAYAQVGHGGDDIDGNHSGDMNLNVNGQTSFSAGGRDAYTQLGHGGRASSGDHTGNIILNGAADVSFTGNRREAYAQLGHGGRSARGNHSGDITILGVDNLSMNAGDNLRAYTQLGHGGFDADGQHQGNIDLTLNNNLTFNSGNATDASSQLGHGGRSARGEFIGDITVNRATDISFTAGNGARASTQLGHGGFDADATRGAGRHQGDITITQANDISFNAAARNQSSAQLGHGGFRANGDHQGNITITQSDAIEFNAAAANDAYAQLGHGGRQSNGNLSGDILVNQSDDITLRSANGRRAYTQLGHGGYASRGNHSGSVTINQANDIQAIGGGRQLAFSQIGHGGYNSDGVQQGSIQLGTVNDISIAAGAGNDAYAQLGHGGRSNNRSHSGDINITRSGNIDVQGGSGRNSYAQIGNGGMFAHGDQTGDISIQDAADVTVQAGSNRESYAQIGHGGRTNRGDHSGNINLNSRGDIQISGGGNTRAYSQVGHGGFNSDGNHNGDIDVDVAQSLEVFAGNGAQASAQLGHGGRRTDGSLSGVINVDAADLDLVGGTGGNNKYAQIGHGDAGTATGSAIGRGARSGDIQVSVGNETSLVNGTGSRSIWRIGHNSRNRNLINNSDVSLATALLDDTQGGGASEATINQDFANKFEHNLTAGDVSVSATGNSAHLINNGVWNYNSGNNLTLNSDANMDINQAITNNGLGDINLNFGQSVAGTLNLNQAVINNSLVSIAGGNGNDVFNLLDGLDTFFPGNYSIDGGAGVETLALLDTVDADGEIYDLTPLQLQKNATTIDYRNFENVVLMTGAGADTVTVTGIPSFTMNLDGGDPSSIPGDTLIAPANVNHVNFESVTLTALPLVALPLVALPQQSNSIDTSLADGFLAEQQNDVNAPNSLNRINGNLYLRSNTINAQFPLRLEESNESPEDWLSWKSSYDQVEGDRILLN